MTTIDKTALSDLVARVEKLEGPNYEAEVEIARALEPERLHWRQTPPNYTYSLDAALGLVERVLPGLYMWRVEFDDEPTPYPCEARVFAEGHIEGGASAKTPALALILAMLRALSDVLERGVDMASLGRTDDLGGDALTRTAEGGE